MKIQDYVLQLLEDNKASDVAVKLGVSQPMVSIYKKGGYNASIDVAIKVYKETEIVLFPFSKEALKELSQ